MKKVSTLEDKGGMPSPKPQNAKHSSKKEPLQSRKSENAKAMTKGGKKPSAEVTKHLETQPRSSKTDASKASNPGKQNIEDSHPENFSRYGTSFTSDKYYKGA